MKEEQILTRIRQVVESEDANPSTLAQRWGIDTSSFAKQLRGERGVSLATVRAILDARPDIDPDWLLNGAGTMSRDGMPPREDCMPRRTLGMPPHEDGMPLGRDGRPLRAIPILPLEAAAGFGADGDDPSCTLEDCERCYLPDSVAEGVNMAIRVSGDSMMPTLMDGDMLLTRPMRSRTDFNWGRLYVLDTTRGAFVKRLLLDAEGAFICRSDNPRYPDFTILPSELRAAYQVVSVLHQV